jgi:diadenosine tetraphosphate (Ap4A) HIT family hydrolase/ADP-ribose pyrophosphatase YjhB (NUDIX family)
MIESPKHWMPRPQWDALVRGENCPLCAVSASTETHDGYAITLADLSLSRLRLARNQYVPGYCLLICRRHVREPYELPDEEYALFFDDLRKAALAIEAVFRPLKMNIEMLGNTVPHLHAHLVPRYYGDPAPDRPIDPMEQKVLLSEPEYADRVRQLRAALARLSRTDRKVRCQGVVMQGDRLLVVEHLNHRTGSVYWWLPGGGLEAGETPEECVVREVREETNLEVRIERLLFETLDPGCTYTYERYITYLCAPTGGEMTPGTEAESSLVHTITGLGWYPLWDERGWERGFYEEHMLPLLKKIKERLVPIETAETGDAGEILRLQKLAYQSEAALHNDYSLPPLTQTLEEIERDFQRQVFLKAMWCGKIMGSVRAYLRDGTCYIGRLIVHPDFQSQGLGTRLLKAVEDHFAGARRYELFTGQKSEGNVRFYERRGYRVFRTEPLSERVILVYFEKVPDRSSA